MVGVDFAALIACAISKSLVVVAIIRNLNFFLSGTFPDAIWTFPEVRAYPFNAWGPYSGWYHWTVATHGEVIPRI